MNFLFFCVLFLVALASVAAVDSANEAEGECPISREAVIKVGHGMFVLLS